MNELNRLIAIGALFRINRRSAWRRRALARTDIRAATARIVFRFRKIGRRTASLRRLEQLLEKRPAPTAARARAVAVGQLAFSPRPLDAQEIDHLALRNLEAQTKLVVEFHKPQADTSPKRERGKLVTVPR